MSHPATAKSILLPAQFPFRSLATLVVLALSGGSTELRSSARRGSGALAGRTLPSGCLIFSTLTCGVALITLRSGRLLLLVSGSGDGALDQLSLRGLDWAMLAQFLFVSSSESSDSHPAVMPMTCLVTRRIWRLISLPTRWVMFIAPLVATD